MTWLNPNGVISISGNVAHRPTFTQQYYGLTSPAPAKPAPPPQPPWLFLVNEEGTQLAECRAGNKLEFWVQRDGVPAYVVDASDDVVINLTGKTPLYLAAGDRFAITLTAS